MTKEQELQFKIKLTRLLVDAKNSAEKRMNKPASIFEVATVFKKFEEAARTGNSKDECALLNELIVSLIIYKIRCF